MRARLIPFFPAGRASKENPSVRRAGTRLWGTAALVALTLPTAGCELAADLYNWGSEFYNDPIELRINLESPPREVDVTPQVNSAEDSLCEDPDSESCFILKEIDKTDDDLVTAPNPRIPDEFPGTISPTDDMGNQLPDPEQPCDPLQPLTPDNCPPLVITMDQFMESAGVYDEIDISEAIPIDLTEEVNVSTPDAIQGVEIRSLGLKYIDNGLTFDTVPFDLYMTLDLLEDANAKELIDGGTLTYLGTIDAQPALTDGTTDIQFESDESRAVFVEGLLARQFTLVFAVPPNTVFQLKDSPTTPDYKLKPQGKTDLAITASLTYTVTPRELVGKAREAYDEQRTELSSTGGF